MRTVLVIAVAILIGCEGHRSSPTSSEKLEQCTMREIEDGVFEMTCPVGVLEQHACVFTQWPSHISVEEIKKTGEAGL